MFDNYFEMNLNILESNFCDKTKLKYLESCE
jgi:hypothetical protein